MGKTLTPERVFGPAFDAYTPEGRERLTALWRTVSKAAEHLSPEELELLVWAAETQPRRLFDALYWAAPS